VDAHPAQVLADGESRGGRRRPPHARQRAAEDPGIDRRRAPGHGRPRPAPWLEAYGIETLGGATTLRIYDPNWPNRDDVTISVEPAAIHQSTGEELFGILSLD
jgi:hypothetical protein